MSVLEKLIELVGGETGLPDDRAERAWLEVAARVDRNGYRPSIVSGKDQNMMTANDPIYDESRSP